jgi:hypothetical protein
MGIQTRVRAFVVLATAVVVLVPATSAEAKSKKPTRVTQMSAPSAPAIGDRAIATATATCPPKARAVGGGFLQTAPVATMTVAAQGSVYESQKVGQNAWRASSQLFTNQAGSILNLETYVYCRRGAPKTTTAVATEPQANGPAIDLPPTASCLGKKKVLAGGFSTPPPFSAPGASTIVLDSVRSGAQAWTSRLLALGNASTLTSYAYCAKAKKGPTGPSVASPVTTGTGSLASAAAPCPAKKKTLGGGFSQPQATADLPASKLGFFIPYESRRIGNAWAVSGMFAGSPPGTIVSTAYCG